MCTQQGGIRNKSFRKTSRPLTTVMDCVCRYFKDDSKKGQYEISLEVTQRLLNTFYFIEINNI